MIHFFLCCTVYWIFPLSILVLYLIVLILTCSLHSLYWVLLDIDMLHFPISNFCAESSNMIAHCFCYHTFFLHIDNSYYGIVITGMFVCNLASVGADCLASILSRWYFYGLVTREFGNVPNLKEICGMNLNPVLMNIACFTRIHALINRSLIFLSDFKFGK